MKNLNRIISLVLVLVLSASCVSVFAQETAEEKELDLNLIENRMIDLATDYIMDNWLYETTKEELYRHALRQIIAQNPELYDTALKGMFGTLDDFSEYYTEEEYDAFMGSLSGEMCGIGVSIMEFSEGLQVLSVYKDSPAEAAGIRQGDIITTVDGNSIVGMYVEVAKQYIIGEKGTDVVIGYIRDGIYNEVSITRGVITVESTYAQILDGNIGYLAISQFDDHLHETVKNALEYFDGEGVGNIIVDLRNNPGGSLDALVQVAEEFVPKGPIVHIDYKGEYYDRTFKSKLKKTKYKLVVLVNEYSASASEAFAGAIQDTKVGTIVGTTTFGKGTMQNVVGTTVGGGIRLTEAEYLTPNKNHVHGEGITPDIIVENAIVTFSDEYFSKFTYDRVMKMHDKGEDVLALKQRMQALGYSVGIPNNKYDEDLYYAVKKFQDSNNLYPYGVCDITTQLAIENALQDEKVVLDKQLETAINVFKNKNNCT